MIINERSWHYRFNVWRSSEWKTKRKKTLCSYFWFTVLNIALFSAFVAAIILILATVGNGMCQDYVNQSFYDVYSLPLYFQLPLFPVIAIIGMAVVIALVMMVFGSLYGIRAMLVWVINRLENKSGHKSNPGLIVSFIKAKKAKVCPLIEFKK